MSPASRDWNTYESKPADPDLLSAGAGEIRNTKIDVRERMVGDHIWDDSVSTDGRHKQMTTKASGSDPSNISGYGIFYTKVVSGITEMFYEDSNGTVIQCTSNGSVAIPAVLLTGDQTIAGVKTFSSSPVVPDPSTATQVANKEYVDGLTFSKTAGGDLSGTYPNPVLNKYDSGWFAVTTTTTYTKTHNLGTTKALISVYLAQNSDGSGWCVHAESAQPLSNNVQFNMVSLSTTQIQLRSQNPLANFVDASSVQRSPTSCYCRVIMLALT